MTEIPIANIYYLLCYAWRHVEESEIVAASELEELRHVQDLLGSVLAAGVRRLVRRGVDRGYQELHEDVAGVRGKLMIGETTKRVLQRRGHTACVTEVLSHDVQHNRLVKSALRDLLRNRGLREDVRSEVRAAHRALSGVSELRLTRRAFRQVQLDRNRRLYRFLLAVSRLALAPPPSPHSSCPRRPLAPYPRRAHRLGAGGRFPRRRTGRLRSHRPNPARLGNRIR